MRKGPSTGEIVALFTVSGMRAARIADRFGVSRAWIYSELKAAGVTMGPRGRKKAVSPRAVRRERGWRNSLVAACDRADARGVDVAAPAEVLPPGDLGGRGNPDLFHCLRVLRANGGKSFPFGVEE